MEDENISENNKIKSDQTKSNAKESLYRITLQNQLRSIGIVDQKANIIIGINTILISIIMATVGLETSFIKFNYYENLALSLPFTILLLFCAASGIVAILVVMPTAKVWIKENPSRLFFRNFENMKIADFKLDMLEIIKSNTSIYDSLDTDIFLYGQIVRRKFRLVRLAYILFMYGLLLTIGSFFALHI